MLTQREERRETLRAELQGVKHLEQNGTVDRSLLTTQIRQRVEESRTLLTRQTSHARQHLRKLVDGPMVFTPQADEPDVWEFKATARLDGLLAGLVIARGRQKPTDWIDQSGGLRAGLRKGNPVLLKGF